ncbi:MAG: hypothetical protein LBV38_05475 [Alistipes sp.]|jgi:hypothetical protein|nr:hypothetical protein [Alistipes sp.]
MRLKTLAIALAATCGVGTLSAQDFEWELRFDTKFDNHERDNLGLEPIKSQTLFSTRIAPSVGIGWESDQGRHRVMAGGSVTLDMGAPLDNRPHEPLIWYNLEAPRYAIHAGKFERRNLTGVYSRAIYAGIALFYDNVIDGMAARYRKEGLRAEVVLDWDGMRSADTRESFRAMLSGSADWSRLPFARWVEGGYSLDWYHLAHTAGGREGVVDHILLDVWIGAGLHRVIPWFDELSLHVGAMMSEDRDRAVGREWISPKGVTADFTVQKWRFGIGNRFYGGEQQMPLFGTYGNRLYKGDPFYAAARLYNYTRVFWKPSIGRGVDLTLEAGFHTDGKKMGYQQTALIGFTLNNDFFKKK